MSTDNDNEAEVVSQGQLARPGEVMPGVLHLLPVTARPFFPGQAVPLLMDEQHWASTIQAIGETPHKLIGIVLTQADSPEETATSDLARVGTLGRIHRAHGVDGRLQVLVECLQRFSIDRFLSRDIPFSARVTYVPENTGRPSDEIKSYAMAIINTIKELLPLNPLYQEELRMFLDRFGPDDPSHLADFAASLTTSDKEALQEVLRNLRPAAAHGARAGAAAQGAGDGAHPAARSARPSRKRWMNVSANFFCASSSRPYSRSWASRRTTAPPSSTLREAHRGAGR